MLKSGRFLNHRSNNPYFHWREPRYYGIALMSCQKYFKLCNKLYWYCVIQSWCVTIIEWLRVARLRGCRRVKLSEKRNSIQVPFSLLTEPVLIQSWTNATEREKYIRMHCNFLFSRQRLSVAPYTTCTYHTPSHGLYVGIFKNGTCPSFCCMGTKPFRKNKKYIKERIESVCGLPWLVMPPY